MPIIVSRSTDTRPESGAHRPLRRLQGGESALCTCREDHRAIVIARISVQRSGCWLWQGTITPAGYGRLRHCQRTWVAHRLSYETFVGPIPNGLVIDHTCRNRACVQPGHLEPVSDRTNILRGTGATARNAQKVVCKNGHGLVMTVSGVRRCGECTTRVRQVRVRKHDLAADDPRHGSVNAYSNLGCRCSFCRAANTAARAKYIVRLRQQKADR